VIITGAGKGLGRVYAEYMAAEGAAIIVNNRRHPGQEDRNTSAFQVAEAIRRSGGSARENFDAVECPESGARMVQQALEHFGRLDAVIANAAIPQASTFSKTTLADYRMIVEVGFFGALHLVHAAWPIFQQNNYGRIITTTSSAGRYGNHGLAAYSAAKAAVEMLTRSLAAEGQNHGIKVNAISPYAYSQMTQDYLTPEIASLFRPEHVAPMVAWLASEHCLANGEVIVAGGGRFRRAYSVETSSVGEKDMAASYRLMREELASAHPSSNAAFASLVREVTAAKAEEGN